MHPTRRVSVIPTTAMSASMLRPLMLLAALLPLTAALPVLTEIQLDLASPTRRVMACSVVQAQCLSQGYLPYYDGRCFYPLSKGPCPEGEWLTLDLGGSGAQLQGRCRPRLCAAGLLPWDGRCLEEEQARAQACGGGPVHVDPSGAVQCGASRGWPPFLSAFVQCLSENGDDNN